MTNNIQLYCKTYFITLIILLFTSTLSTAEAINSDLETSFNCPNVIDYDALIALYNSTNGSSWINNTGWIDGAAGIDCDVCNWYGVACDFNGRVTKLNLPNNGLTGNIPTEIGSILELETINLSGNSLFGNVPPEISTLIKLRIFNLSNNTLSGQIPVEVGLLTELYRLRLGNNNLTGAIPTELGACTKIVNLDLSSNNLSGNIAIVNDLPWLYDLDLSFNSFTGEIPSNILNRSYYNYFNVESNFLQGPLPSPLGFLEEISYVNFAHNDLSGCIPEDYSTLCNPNVTVYLDFNSCLSHGSYFPNFCNNSSCETLPIGSACPCSNGVQDPTETNIDCGGSCLPCTLCPDTPDYAALIAIYNSTNGLYWNNNSGWSEGADGTNCDVCTWYGVGCDNNGRVRKIDIGNNNLSGKIPNEIGLLTELEEFYMSNNNLIGTIPNEISECTEIVHLYLNNNNLSGNIFMVDQLPNMIGLNLSYNNFNGEIPKDILNRSSYFLFNVESNSLEGSLPHPLGTLDYMEYLSFENNNLSGCIPESYSTLCGRSKLEVFMNNNLCLSHNGDFDLFCSNPVCETLPNTSNCLCSNGIQDPTETNIDCGGSCLPCDPCSSVVDYAALVDLYNMTGGPTWKNNSGWVEGAAGNNCDICTWSGVICNGDGRVRTLNMGFNNVTGELPASIGTLDKLEYLTLNRNNLTGEIPPEIGLLTSIKQINLDRNQLEGELPMELGALTTLTSLKLYSNNLSGCIPEELDVFCDITVDVTDNPCLSHGGFFSSFCDGDVCELPTYPDCILPSCNNGVQDLNETGIDCGGPDCHSCDPCSSVTDYAALVDLYNTTGGPTWTNNTGWVEGAAGNNCDICTWSGVICNGDGRVRILNMGFNNITGELPASIGTLDKLEYLTLNRNNLSGEMPSELGLLTSIKHINLDRNQLEGEIPMELGALTTLTSLKLYSNNLSGCIPEELDVFCDITVDVTDNPCLSHGGFFSSFCDGDVCELPTYPDCILPSCNNGVQDLNETGIDCGGPDCHSCDPCSSVTDYAALVDLYNTTGGPTWTNNTGWVEGAAGNNCDICTWSGVICNGDGRVRILNMGFNNITGELPASIGTLDKLEYLTLNRNNLSGEMPSELGLLTSIKHINLDRNQLEGEIPMELGSLTTLTSLKLYSNNLSGCIPDELDVFCNNTVDVTDNPCLSHGGFFSSFCDGDVCELPTYPDCILPSCSNGVLDGNETAIDCGGPDCHSCDPCSSVVDYAALVDFYNETGGPAWTNNTGWIEGVAGDNCDVCSWFGVLCNSDGRVRGLNIGFNNLTGVIPTSIGSLDKMEYLTLNRNFLSGEIPSEMGLLTSIKHINLDRNQLEGEIPVELGTLTTLTRLQLYSNNLSGCIPDALDIFCDNTVNVTDNPCLSHDGVFSSFCAGDACVLPTGPDCLEEDLCANGIKDNGEYEIDCGGPNCEPCRYDLSYEALNVVTSSVQNGSLIEVNYIVGNPGQINVETFPHAFYLSSDDVLDNNDIEIFSEFLAYDPYIMMGSIESGSTVFDIPVDISSGNYFLIAKVDPTDYFNDEIDEDNNVISISITIEENPCYNGELDTGEDLVDCGGECIPCLPDLIASSIIISTTQILPTSQGDIVNAMIEVANAGAIGVDFYVAVYLSEDDFLTVNERVLRLKYEYDPNEYNLGEIISENIAFGLLSDQTVGSYKLYLTVDYEEEYEELDETNNSIFAEIYVEPGSCCNNFQDQTESGIDEGGLCGIYEDNLWDNHYEEFFEDDIDRQLNTSHEVGSIAGQHSTSNTGAAQYHIPISVPAGINGLAPNVSLAYSSQSKYSGPMGLGWSLQGTSSISRMARNEYFHDEIEPINHESDDALHLDGMALYLNPGGYYQTRAENFSRIIPQGQATNGTLSFEVREKSGYIKYYGTNSNSRKEKLDGTVIHWMLDKVVDNYGNEMNYYYNHNNDEITLDKIEYASSINTPTPNKIKFNYNKERGDKNVKYERGVKSTMRSLLSDIEVFDQIGGQVATYSFNYGSHFDPSLKLNSQLKELIQTGSDGTVLNSTLFQYGKAEIPAVVETITSLPEIEESISKIADLNGDGRDDIVIITIDEEDPYARFYITNPDGTFSNVDNKYLEGGNGERGFTHDDLVSFFADAIINYMFEALTGSAWLKLFIDSYTAPWSQSLDIGKSFQVLDFNGDSKDDIVYFEACDECETQVIQIISLDDANNGIVENITVQRAHGSDYNVFGINVQDFDGDSKGDILLKFVNNDSQTKSQHYYIVPSTLNYSTIFVDDTNIASNLNLFWQSQMNTGNFNGDSKTDIIFTHINESNTSRIYEIDFHDTWAEFVPIDDGAELSYPSFQNAILTTGDFNGDGLTDILTGTTHCVYEIGIFDGTKFIRQPFFFEDEKKPKVEWSFYFRNVNLNHRDLLIASDFNNDGKDDIVFYPNSRSGIGDEYCNERRYVYAKPELYPISIYYSTGLHFERTTLVEEAQTQALLNIGDFNGDGIKDIFFDNFVRDKENMCAQTIATFKQSPEIIYINKDADGYLLKNVLDGMNRKVSFDYRNLSSFNVYEIETTSLAFPVNTYTPKLKVVYKEYVPNGIADTRNEITYKYCDAIYHRTGGGFLGFGRIDKSDPTNNLFTRLRSTLDKSEESGEVDIYNLIPLNLETTIAGELASKLNYHNTVVRLGADRIWYKNDGQALQDFFNKKITFNRIEYDGVSYNGSVNPSTNYGNITRSFSKISKINGDELWSSEKIFSNFNSNGSFIPNKPEYIETTTTKVLGNYSFSHNTSLTYNNEGSLLSKTDFDGLPESVTTTYSNFDSYGNSGQVTITGADNLSRSTSYTYDSSNRYVETSTNSLGQVSSIVYDYKWGKPMMTTAIDGLITSFTYDGFGRSKTSTSPTNVVTSIDYLWAIGEKENSLHKMEQLSQGAPSQTSWYDMYNRTVYMSAEDFGGETTYAYKTYNEKGLLSTESSPFRDPMGDPLITSYIYDVYNRIVSIDNPTNDLSYVYSTADNGTITTTVTTEEGKSQISKTNALGQMTYREDPGSIITSYKIDAINNPREVKVDGVTVSVMGYDEYGRQTTLDDKGGFGVMTYGYNGFGELDYQLDPKGNETITNYDPHGRVDNIVVAGESLTDYTYVASGNGLNQIQSVSYNYQGTNPYTNTETFTYDALNRLESTTETINGSAFTHAFTYNDNNQIMTETYPSGLVASYNYDGKGFLENITSNNKIVYEPLATNNYGQLTSYKLGNGLTSIMQYDEFGFLKRSFTENNSAFDMSYDFNTMNGNLNWRKDATIGGPNGLTETFSYDPSFDRLTNAAHGTTSTDFTYQNNGNILTKTDVSANPYVYDANKMYQVTDITEAIGVADLSETISYNAAQQPIQISQEGGTSGNTNLTIHYGADQQRRYAQLSGNGTSDYHRYYVGDFERNIKNGVTQDIHSIAPGVIIVGENNVYSEYYTYSDHLGSINVVTDNSGTVVARQSFDAWGRKRNATDWTYDNVDDYELSWLHRGYTGHEMLPEFGLINMNGRLYDNYIGRMLSPDEYSGQDGTSQSFNRYTYAFNNPLKYSDPGGENPIIGPAVYNAIMSQGYILPTIIIKETLIKPISEELIKVVAKELTTELIDQSIQRYDYSGSFSDYQRQYGLEGESYNNILNSWIENHGADFDNYIKLQDKIEADRIAIEKMKIFTFLVSTSGSMSIGLLTPKLPAPRAFRFSSPISSPKSPNETVYGYHGVDNTGVKYVGISNNPTTRFGAHSNSLGSGKEFLRYGVKASFKTRIEARIWEQSQIRRFGLRKNGGSLLNKRNEIAQKYWSQYGIF
jgi:RHS repeat-associated protein